jgi:hypothetical protein
MATYMTRRSSAFWNASSSGETSDNRGSSTISDGNPMRPLSAFSRIDVVGLQPLGGMDGLEADLQPRKAPPQTRHVWLVEAVSAKEQHRRGICPCCHGS